MSWSKGKAWETKDSTAIWVWTDQKHANQVRNINKGELGVAVTKSAKKHQENQDWTTWTHLAYTKEGNIQLTNELNTEGGMHMRGRETKTDRTHSVALSSG